MVKIFSTGPYSTILPIYMTATSSAISATTPILWVIIMMAVLCSFFRLFIRSKIWALMVTSRAVVGSSDSRIFGSQDIPMAIMER